ncbi:MAG: DEAD/DEAH box helicase family protein [Lachnospiraceae bacterium]|jgi:type III restriction enzyme|nr:DEAD/DEAH box helicase family protein [Lachnospiraceae bacterium]
MKLQFKHQKFQAEAAKAVVDVFAGQPYLLPSDRTERDLGDFRKDWKEADDFMVWPNVGIVPELSDERILEQLNRVQRSYQVEPSCRLEGKFNLTVEMETGVGKTYTYIKTIYELNKQYGWCKFIVVVPSVAIREGVYRSFGMTQEHFAEEYGKKIRFFIYQSSKLTEIDRFVSDSSIYVMIINSQSFNTKGKEARRIYMKLDDFGSRRPIDMIARTNPIVIIDEPQSVEGKQTKKNLKAFHPLMTLRYSATHKKDSIYNMVYRLDAVEAYRMHLVKKIAVKGIAKMETAATAATDGYVYLESIHMGGPAPVAVLQFDWKSGLGVKKIWKKAGIGFNLYEQSGRLSVYKDGFTVKAVDGYDNSVEFANGIKVYAGDAIGRVEEEQLRRLQIRETILSHLERERQLFDKGIKVLSLFFIDEVAHYKEYDSAGRAGNGIFARMFEEEYRDIISNLQQELDSGGYREYLEAIPAEDTHAGYFSVDKKGRMVNRIAGDDRKGMVSNDLDAYDLIMRNKELLLDCHPKNSPVRFIFSHSALREGWDNPNVFQICTLKRSSSDVRKRQEVGRGLRLCVNQKGERMDENALGGDVHKINVLTVIAGESYESFARGLQEEIAETVADRMANGTGGKSVSYDDIVKMPENARSSNVELHLNRKKQESREFRELWNRIRTKSVYKVDFDKKELVERCVDALNHNLKVSKIFFRVESGQIEDIRSKENLHSGVSMRELTSVRYEGGRTGTACHEVKYDLVGKVAGETGLTRKATVQILTGIEEPVFNQFKDNPEEFIRKASGIINEQKAAVIAGHIAYEALDEKYDMDIFNGASIKGKLGMNAMKVDKHLYDYVIYDSESEKALIQKLEAAAEVAVYVKLPEGFSIPTPAGRYTPGWAISLYEGAAEHTFYVVETKDAKEGIQPCLTETWKRNCAKEHFKAVNGEDVVFLS